MDTNPRASRLRFNQTDAEKLLWSKLRNNQLGYKFRRQQPLGPYIADFYCAEKRLVIELDGGQHTQEKDKKRDDFLSSQKMIVIHFWNNDVLMNIEGVVQKILIMIEQNNA